MKKKYRFGKLFDANTVYKFKHRFRASDVNRSKGTNCCTVEPLYSKHHCEPTFCPLEQGICNSGSSSIFPLDVVYMCNQAIEHNMTTFSLAVRWRQRLM